MVTELTSLVTESAAASAADSSGVAWASWTGLGSWEAAASMAGTGSAGSAAATTALMAACTVAATSGSMAMTSAAGPPPPRRPAATPASMSSAEVSPPLSPSNELREPPRLVGLAGPLSAPKWSLRCSNEWSEARERPPDARARPAIAASPPLRVSDRDVS